MTYNGILLKGSAKPSLVTASGCLGPVESQAALGFCTVSMIFSTKISIKLVISEISKNSYLLTAVCASMLIVGKLMFAYCSAAEITGVIFIRVCFLVLTGLSTLVAIIVAIIIRAIADSFVTVVTEMILVITAVCAITADSGIFAFVTDMIRRSSVYAIGQNLSASVVTYVIAVSISIGTSAHSFCSAVVTYVIGILVITIELSNGYVAKFNIIANCQIGRTVGIYVESTVRLEMNVLSVNKLIFSIGQCIQRHCAVQGCVAIYVSLHINSVNNDFEILLSVNNVALGRV